MDRQYLTSMPIYNILRLSLRVVERRTIMFCDQCGKPMPDGSLFCPNCGAKNLASIAPEKETIKPFSETGNTPDRQPIKPFSETENTPDRQPIKPFSESVNTPERQPIKPFSETVSQPVAEPIKPNEQVEQKPVAPVQPVVAPTPAVELNQRDMKERTRMENTVPVSNYQTDVLYKPISVLGYLGIFLLMCIPLVNIILLFVWAFSKDTNKNKKNLAIASLIMIVISIVLSIVFSVVFGAMFSEMIEFMSY